MAGIENAVKRSSQLILMFDQYFWSRPLARLLNDRLNAVQSLHVIVILPPHADSFAPSAHHARALALDDLTAGFTKTGGEYERIAVYNLWHNADRPPELPLNRGIYVHAKAHTYDGDLLVCGSANLNRRSFLCDSEIACAVLDPAVVLAHQSALWAYLFGGASRPNVDLSGTDPNRGAQLFSRSGRPPAPGLRFSSPIPGRTRIRGCQTITRATSRRGFRSSSCIRTSSIRRRSRAPSRMTGHCSATSSSGSRS